MLLGFTFSNSSRPTQGRTSCESKAAGPQHPPHPPRPHLAGKVPGFESFFFALGSFTPRWVVISAEMDREDLSSGSLVHCWIITGG